MSRISPAAPVSSPPFLQERPRVFTTAADPDPDLDPVFLGHPDPDPVKLGPISNNC